MNLDLDMPPKYDEFIQKVVHNNFADVKLAWNIAEWMVEGEGVGDLAVVKLALVILLCRDVKDEVLNKARWFLSKYRRYKVLLILEYMEKDPDNFPIIMKEMDVTADVLVLILEVRNIQGTMKANRLLHTVSGSAFRNHRNTNILNILLFR